VGTKVDKRDITVVNPDVVTPEEGDRAAAEFGAVGYIETSARSMVGLKVVFDTVVRESLAHQVSLSIRIRVPCPHLQRCFRRDRRRTASALRRHSPRGRAPSCDIVG